MESRIVVSGNIISELSEKIPSNIVALNELIKNAYDAGANSIEIILNSLQKTMVIIDDGEGMDKNDIDTLFHISNSQKHYGELNKKYNRYTQGSKGLGFLSVFKFGHQVTWETKKDKGYKFTVNFRNVVSQDDISAYTINLYSSDITKGTKITIQLNDYALDSLTKYFQEEKNYRKIVNSFDDKNFSIVLKFDNHIVSSKNEKNILDIDPKSRLYYVTYSCENEKIIFNYNGYDIIERNYPFQSKRFSLEIELLIFSFKSYGKNKIDKLYFNPNDDLTPLIYINSNLFYNYAIFDPNIMRNIKSSLVLGQMIGKVKIISNDNDINFNSDRTQFLQNELTDDIQSFIKGINKEIQTIGSEAKKYLVNFDFIKGNTLPEECTKYLDTEEFRKFVYDDFIFKDKVEIVRNGNQVVFSLFGKSISKDIEINSKAKDEQKKDNDSSINPVTNIENKKYVPAEIKLNVDSILKINLPSEGQIDLYNYIDYVKNSEGKLIDNKFVVIKVIDNDLNELTNIIPSVTIEKQIKIEFSFNDSNTGIAIKELILDFRKPTNNFIVEKSKVDLLFFPVIEGYRLNYNPYINKLVTQLNNLYRQNYNEVISCCLRSLFEISIDSIAKSNKFNNFFDKKELDVRAEKVINYIKSNASFCTAIVKSTSIDYQSFCNMLDPISFKEGIKKCNLGAHKSGIYVTKSDIETLGKLASIFMIITNEMINNTQIS